MRKLILSALFALSATSIVAAADIERAYPTKAPSPIPYADACPFCGFYIGGHFGYGWVTTGQDAFITGQNVNTLLASLANSPQGVLGGIHGGYGQRAGILYLGIEADIDIAALNGSATAFQALTTETKQNFFGTVRARLGFTPVPHFMPYVTAGLAYGDTEESFTLANVGTASVSKTKTGWAFGGGIENDLGGGWTAGLEYLRIDLGKASVEANNIRVDANFQADTVRAKISKHF